MAHRIDNNTNQLTLLGLERACNAARHIIIFFDNLCNLRTCRLGHIAVVAI